MQADWSVPTSNSLDPDETAHYEVSCLDLHCLHYYLFWSAGLKGLLYLYKCFVVIPVNCHNIHFLGDIRKMLIRFTRKSI